MVRILIERVVEYTGEAFVKYVEAAGLSTDTKPTAGIATGSTFMEVDTGKVYIFDEASSDWTELGESNNG